MNLHHDPNTTPQDIIHQAIEVFCQKGYAQTSMKDVTDGLSLSRGPIYYYFKDKYGLYKASYDVFEETLKAIHERFFPAPIPTMEKIKKLLMGIILDTRKFNRHFFLGLRDIAELSDIAKRYDTLNEAFLRRLHGVILEGQAKGELTSTLTKEEITTHIYVVFYGLLSAVNSKLLDFQPDESFEKVLHRHLSPLLP
ncbi:MAG TPA: hypothetical protein DEA52_03110 [Clostridiaceae bacterium]|nr:hypothetical protein [Clostridiaceae bacterium]